MPLYLTVSSAIQYIPCLKKAVQKLFSSELRQISTSFDNFWHKGEKEAKIMRDVLIFYLT